MSNKQLVELVFVLDASGSMGPWIRSAEKSIKNIIKQIRNSNKLASPSAFRVGVLAYRDVEGEHFVDFLTKSCPLTYNIDEVHTFLEGLGAAGGGDGPDAAATALDVALNDANVMGWLDPSMGAHRTIVHFTDSPPHGMEPGDPKNPTKEAETAGMFKNIVKANEILKHKNIKYFVVSCGEMGKTYTWAVPFYRRTTSGNGYMLPLTHVDLLPNALISLALEDLALSVALQDMRAELQKLNPGKKPSFANSDSSAAPAKRPLTTTETLMTLEKAVELIQKMCDAKGVKGQTYKTNIAFNFIGKTLQSSNITETTLNEVTEDDAPREQTVEIVYESLSDHQLERMVYRYNTKPFVAQVNNPVARIEVGNFNSADIRPWQKPQAHNVATIQLQFTNPFPPGILLGLNHLSFNILRMKSHVQEVTNNSVKIDLESWANTWQNSAGVALLSIPNSETDIQFGLFNTMMDHAWNQPKKSTTRAITFDRPYAHPPKVVVWLESADIGAEQNCRILTKVENITQTGFTLHIDTWSDTNIWSGGAYWLAYPADRQDIRSGTFSTNDVRPWNVPRLENSDRLYFSGGPLRKVPQVFAAFNQLDIANSHQIRVKVRLTEVAIGGLTWHLDSWADTVHYSSSASFIAFE